MMASRDGEDGWWSPGGTVNALAADTGRFAEALRRGESGIGPISLFDTAEFRTHNGAQVKDFNSPAAIPR